MKTDYAAQCRFFSAEDACRIALQAYYAATRHLEPPPGEPWMVDGDPFASATDFAEAFNGEVQARLGLLALDRLGGFHGCSVEWDVWKIAADAAPEKMAPIIAEREADHARAMVEIFGDELNGLPPEDNQVNNRQSNGVQNA
jgi:hypothetical protein